MKYLDIYKILDKSNCRECGLLTCLAFVHAVVNGTRKIGDCTHLDKKTVSEVDKKIIVRDIEKEYEIAMGPLKEEISRMDFRSVAESIGATISDDKLRINCLGKSFFVDHEGNVESILHVHLWVTVPMLRYIIAGGGEGLSGRWVSFDELKNGITMSAFFMKRCVEPLKKMTDLHTDIFFDLLDIFGGQHVEGISSDRGRVIYPLPRLPVLFLYWNAEEQFASNLKVLFDSSADTYLDFEAIFILMRGLVEMFKKIIANHEEVMPNLLAM